MNSKFNQGEELRIRMSIHAEMAMQRFGRDIGILHFDNIYTPILAHVLQEAGGNVTIYHPVFNGFGWMELEGWCKFHEYECRTVHVDLEHARDIGLETEQPSLLRAAMYLVAHSTTVPWIAVPEELRIVKTDDGWRIAKTKSLRLWQKHHHEYSHMLWANGSFAETYLRTPIIQELITDQLPGKRSNRSSEHQIWGPHFDLYYPRHEYRLAMRPLWEHYSGELLLKNEHNISQITIPVEEYDGSH